MIVLRSSHCGRKIVKPRRMNRNASVTMKLGRPVRTTMTPLIAPIAMQIAKVSRIDAHIGQPSVMAKTAIVMPAKPIIDPTDRSNSPAIISRHAPTAMIMNCADTTDQFSTPCGANIPEDPAVRKKNTNTKVRPQIPPSSGRISARRSQDVLLIRSSGAATGSLSVVLIHPP